MEIIVIGLYALGVFDFLLRVKYFGMRVSAPKTLLRGLIWPLRTAWLVPDEIFPGDGR